MLVSSTVDVVHVFVSHIPAALATPCQYARPVGPRERPTRRAVETFSNDFFGKFDLSFAVLGLCDFEMRAWLGLTECVVVADFSCLDFNLT